MKKGFTRSDDLFRISKNLKEKLAKTKDDMENQLNIALTWDAFMTIFIYKDELINTLQCLKFDTKIGTLETLIEEKQ